MVHVLWLHSTQSVCNYAVSGAIGTTCDSEVLLVPQIIGKRYRHHRLWISTTCIRGDWEALQAPPDMDKFYLHQRRLGSATAWH